MRSPLTSATVARIVLHLCTIVVEDAHQADRHGLVDAATQGFPGEGEHERDALFPTGVDDGVKSLVQAAYEKGHFLRT